MDSIFPKPFHNSTLFTVKDGGNPAIAREQDAPHEIATCPFPLVWLFETLENVSVIDYALAIGRMKLG